MDAVTILDQNRLFPAEPTTRAIARKLYGTVCNLPIISPHGHTDARWYAENEPFPDPTSLFIVPDHYIFRMLYSQGIPLEDLGIGLEERLSATNADTYYDTISAKLALPSFRPRALYDQFNIEVLATTNSPLDPLTSHQAIRDSGWKARIVPTFRPDSVVDPVFD